jgi:hypothetical protein
MASGGRSVFGGDIRPQNSPPDKNETFTPSGTVPEFEGAESGTVTESVPVEGVEEEVVEESEESEEIVESDEGEPVEETESEPVLDPMRLDIREAQLDAKEAKLIAEQTRLISEQNSNQGQGNTEQEVFKSILADIDPEGFESEGERALFQVAQTLEKDLHDTKIQVADATHTSNTVLAETNISRVMSQYDVTRAELDTQFQRTGVRDMESLAKNVLFDRGETEKSRVASSKGQQRRTKSVSKVASGEGSSTAKRTTTEGRGIINPFRGEDVAKKYKAFE